MYYECIICYVDDVIFIIEDTLLNMKGIQTKFKLKGNKTEEPYMYLAAYLSNITRVDGKVCWSMSSDKYYVTDMTNVESVLENRGLRFLQKCVTPIRCGYCP